MAYMSTSEQVASMIAVGCLIEGDQVSAAGGYIVQLLPEVAVGPLAIMTERLRDFENIDALLTQTSAVAALLLEELLYGFPFTKLSESPLKFKCRCSAMRVIASLTTLPRVDIQDMIDKHEVVDMTCEFCGQAYAVGPTQLRGLLDES
jgi:molecular chaperone Hsp33